MKILINLFFKLKDLIIKIKIGDCECELETPPVEDEVVEDEAVEDEVDEDEVVEDEVVEDEVVEDEVHIIDGHEFVHVFDHAVITEYYVGDNCGTETKIGCMGTVLTENYSCASHNMPCGTKLYIPALKGVVNDTGIFEVEDTGGMSFDFDIFTGGDKRNKIGKKNMEVYVLQWGQKKLTCSYTYIIDYFKRLNRFETYRESWELYKKMGGQVIKFWQFREDDKTLNIDEV